MRVLFMGSGALACPALQRLWQRSDVDVVGVVTQPDRPAGRNLQARPCPVRAQLFERPNIPVLTPERVNDEAVVEAIRALHPELFVVAAYGQILRPALLDIPPLGAINIHPSLLPRYRGASPIQWAIANGERETGVTIQFMSPRMDAGDIILARAMPIEPEDTTGTLEPRLANLGAELLDEVLDMFQHPPVPRQPQDESLAIYAPKLKKDDGLVDWTWPAEKIRNRIRGLHPWPGAFTWMPGPKGPVRLKLHAARVERGRGEPGTIVEMGREGPLVATGEDCLRLLRVQPEGRPVMEGAAFSCGYWQLEGQRLGA